jgi:CDP-paratose 2-epimerase
MTRHASVDLKGSPDRFGYECGVSLAELTEACAERAGRRVDITSQPDTNPVDIPYYVTDNSAVTTATGWRSRLSMSDILDDIFGWLREHGRELEAIPK